MFWDLLFTTFFLFCRSSSSGGELRFFYRNALVVFFLISFFDLSFFGDNNCVNMVLCFLGGGRSGRFHLRLFFHQPQHRYL